MPEAQNENHFSNKYMWPVEGEKQDVCKKEENSVLSLCQYQLPFLLVKKWELQAYLQYLCYYAPVCSTPISLFITLLFAQTYIILFTIIILNGRYKGAIETFLWLYDEPECSIDSYKAFRSMNDIYIN